jgi:hypothetical protein
METFNSRCITKLFDDVYAALEDVQSVRSRHAKVMRVLETLHERGWKIQQAEPVKPAHRENGTLELDEPASALVGGTA